MLKITLIDTGIALDLPEDFSLDMEFNNPLFADDDIQGDYSLSSSVQWTDTNIKAFRFVNVLDASQRLGDEYDAKIEFGSEFLPGKIVTEDCTDKRLNFRFKTNLGNFKKLVDKTLGEFEYADSEVDFTDALQPTGFKTIAAINTILKNELSETTSQFGTKLDWVPVPVYAPTMADGEQWGDTVNYYREAQVGYPTEFFDPSGIPANNQWYSFFVFFPAVRYVLERICKESGYNLTNEVFDAELNRLLLFSNYVYYMSYAPQVPQMNDVRDDTVYISRTVPDIDSAQFIKELCKLLCSMAIINERRKTVRFVKKKDVLRSREYEDWTQYAVPGFRMLKSDYTGLKLEYNFGASDTFADDEFEDFDITTAGTSVATFSALAGAGGAVGTIRFVEDERRYYIKKDLTTWEVYSQPFQYTTVNDGNKTITLNMAPMFMYRGMDVYADTWLGPAAQRDWLVPKIQTAGAGYAYTLGERNDAAQLFNEMRVFFYRGLKQDSEGDDYPLSTSEEYDYAGNVIGNYSLNLNGTRGIKNVFYADYGTFRNNAKPVEMNFRLNFEQLINMSDYWEKMIRVNEINWRISRIRVRLQKYHIGIAEALLYSC